MPTPAKVSQKESSEMGPLALYGETEELLKELGMTSLSAVPPTPLPLRSVALHLHAFAAQQGFGVKPIFTANRRTFKCTRFRQRGLAADEMLCDVFFEVVETEGGWTVGRMQLDHTHDMEEDPQALIRTRWDNSRSERRSGSVESSQAGSSREKRVLRSRETRSSRGSGSGSDSESDSDSGSIYNAKASHWDFPITQQDLVEAANAILLKAPNSPPPFPSVNNGVCYPTAREFRIQSYAAARSQGFSLAAQNPDTKLAIEKNEFRLRCSVQDRSGVLKSCGALMTIGCRKGFGGSDEWYVVEEDSHLYHVVDTKWKGKGKLSDLERVKTPSTVPLKRYPSSSTLTPPSNSRSPSGMPPTKIFRPSPASTSQHHQTNSTKRSSSSSTPKLQARFDVSSTPAALPTTPPPVSSKSLTEFLYFLSPNLATFAALLHHRGGNNIDSLLLLFEQDKTRLSSFYNSLGSLTDLEKSTGSNLKVMPLLSSSLLSSKLKKLKNGDSVERGCGLLD